MMMQVAHVTGEVHFPKTKEGKVDMGWAAGQVATTADFSHGSWFWTHFSGGLNYQVCPCLACRLPSQYACEALICTSMRHVSQHRQRPKHSQTCQHMISTLAPAPPHV